MMPSGVKSRPQVSSKTCRPGLVGAGQPPSSGHDTRIYQILDLGDRFLAKHCLRLGSAGQPNRSDVALDQLRMRGEILVSEWLRHGGIELGCESLQVDLPIARHADDQRMTCPIDLSDHDDHVLQGVAACQGRSVRGKRALARPTRVSMVGVFGVSST